MNVGFVGLGYLGKAIAGRLQSCGHSLTVWNRTPGKEEGLEVTVAPSAAKLTSDSEIICLCMFDSEAVRTVLTDPEGVLAGDVSGKVIVDFTTNHFKEVLEFHELVGKAGAKYLEAPVLGSVVPASMGALTVIVSGDKEAYDIVTPLLEDVGQHLFHLGAPGASSKMKLINNLTLGSFMATLAEALVMGEACGMEKKDVLDILAVGGGNSKVLDAKRGKLLEEDFSTHFSNALIYKDLHCLQDLAFDLKKTLFTGSLLKELFGKTYEDGIEQEDFSAIYKVFKRG